MRTIILINAIVFGLIAFADSDTKNEFLLGLGASMACFGWWASKMGNK